MSARPRHRLLRTPTEAALSYREEARRFDQLADALFEDSEDLLARSTRAREQARAFDEMADAIEDEEEVARLAGGLAMVRRSVATIP